jgi:hypothetical protein
MTVCWQTRANTPEASRPARLEFQKTGESLWRTAAGDSRPMPHAAERTNHRAELTGLQPGATYRFRFDAAGKTYSFRTLPARADRPVRFVTGGDTMHDKRLWEKTNRQALTHDPEFVLLGGDLAYENGDPKLVRRVLDWLDGAKNTLITDEGRVVPILASIGNHEVAGSYLQKPERAPFFYSLFPFPGPPGYNVLDAGDYLSLVLLDSNHTSPVGGAQTQWLSRTLFARRDRPHVFPIYHVPGYPSHRAFEGSISKLVRQHWSPLFERYGVRVAFENHDHAYKRTHPLRDGKVDTARGVTYLGDGAWGVRTRQVHPERWYLARALSARHFILVTLQGRHQHFEAIDDDGRVIDRYPESPALPGPIPPREPEERPQ